MKTDSYVHFKMKNALFEDLHVDHIFHNTIGKKKFTNLILLLYKNCSVLVFIVA